MCDVDECTGGFLFFFKKKNSTHRSTDLHQHIPKYDRAHISTNGEQLTGTACDGCGSGERGGCGKGGGQPADTNGTGVKTSKVMLMRPPGRVMGIRLLR